ncbi:glycosyltransferase [Butyrivibrio sp. AC2005]|uniref:glycosyltransferase n=1 Tax=Butyrivibrio sp. AC2005 TaxID=1280672 RepID=UPI0004082506|nr:glycosyltransferase [Butyrivibrio sp. AC2005]
MGISRQHIINTFSDDFGDENIACELLEETDPIPPHEIRSIAIQYFFSGVGGTERVIAELAKMLLNHGYDVCLIFDDTENSFFYDFHGDYEVYYIPNEEDAFKTNNYEERANALESIIKDNSIDLIINNSYYSRILPYDLLIYKLCSTYSVIIQHGLISQSMTKLLDSIYLQWKVFPFFDGVVTLNKMENEVWKCFCKNVAHIPDPVSYVDELNKIVIDKKWNQIIWVGRLDNTQKQVMELIPIMKYVCERIPEAYVVIYGPEEEFGLLERMMLEIKRNHLENNIIYGGVLGNEIHNVYETSSVQLVTSAYESFGMAIYEGKWHSLPLVTYDMPYLDLLQTGGYIAVRQGDKKAAANALVKIMLDEALKEKLSKEARESAEMYSGIDIFQKWSDFFSILKSNTNVERHYNNEKDMLKTLLETIFFHYHIGVGKKNVLASKVVELDRNLKIHKCLLHELKNIGREYIIYPYGKIGKMTKTILNNDFGVLEEAVLDNNSNEKSVKTTDYLNELDVGNIYILFACGNDTIREELFMEITKYIAAEKVIDVLLNNS